jgi:hypothetical protein
MGINRLYRKEWICEEPDKMCERPCHVYFYMKTDKEEDVPEVCPYGIGEKKFRKAEK